jgi:aryl-alcohol dehydrogenase-like predicted oxidoreductase
MDSFPLGRFSVGRIGFGAIQLPGPGAFGPSRDRDAALAVLRRAVELGVDHIDTAQFYGPNVSNELIREALHPYPANLALVSKVGARRDDAGGWISAVGPQPGPDRVGVGAERGAERAADSGDLVGATPGGEPGRRRHRARRRDS